MMVSLDLTLKNKDFKNNNTSPIHPLHSLNTLPAKRSEAERGGSVIVKTRTLSVSSVSTFVSPILRLTLLMGSSFIISNDIGSM